MSKNISWSSKLFDLKEKQTPLAMLVKKGKHSVVIDIESCNLDSVNKVICFKTLSRVKDTPKKMIVLSCFVLYEEIEDILPLSDVVISNLKRYDVDPVKLLKHNDVYICKN